jgi:cell division protein FtsI/penicillin-binding protein 2
VLRNYFILALLAMVFMGCASKRGNIYDRNGAAIVEHSSKRAVATYIHPQSVSHVVGYTVVDATSQEMMAKQGLEKQYD